MIWVHLVFVNCKKRFGVVPDVFTCKISIKALCNRNNIDGALKLLDEMPTMGMVPNVVTYITIMGGYVSRVRIIWSKPCHCSTAQSLTESLEALDGRRLSAFSVIKMALITPLLNDDIQL
ncbi:hypothetical protein FEM48_Zijuj07G0013900 [Ziziphus jujuba var. spinosa]|uniref:Pentatricopeptide repeat-containing protein n=1 Tax=Ziziphus jujuba var. spinosa TaxID=714518 RepID=A0A978V1M4_ZIZJJ|nr:hypothetical protein FEM48_Zijuj07G0013900 [Ziziphus jujuba var. spinosa]